MKLSELIKELQQTMAQVGDCDVQVRGKKNESAIEGAIAMVGEGKPRVVLQMPPNMECARLLPVKKLHEI